jgi:hypothetical protein
MDFTGFGSKGLVRVTWWCHGRLTGNDAKAGRVHGPGGDSGRVGRRAGVGHTGMWSCRQRGGAGQGWWVPQAGNMDQGIGFGKGENA